MSGTVTLDGRPLEKGLIRFIPKDGKGPTAGGAIVNGAYSAEVPVGPVRIEITSSKVVGQSKIYDTPDSPLVDQLEEIIPARYNKESQLGDEIKPGKNVIPFDLKSD